MNADQFVITLGVVIVLAALVAMRYASTHVYMKYNKTGNCYIDKVKNPD